MPKLTLQQSVARVEQLANEYEHANKHNQKPEGEPASQADWWLVAGGFGETADPEGAVYGDSSSIYVC